MNTQNLSVLKINKLKTQAQYDAAFAAGKVNSNEIYLTPDTSIDLAYGVCNTAASTATKTVTIENFVLKEGATIIVKFTNNNSVASPTLNVNGTGAKPIYIYGTTAAGADATTTSWVAGAVQMLVYDGTGWVRNYWSNTTYSNASLGQGYAICDTAAATAAKTATLTSYSATTGGIVAVKFANNVLANANLNINSKGAKAIYYKGEAISENIIKAGDIATFIYDGTNYHLLSIDRWQEDINNKQATITGAATTITSNNLTASRALISNSSGKVAVSDITSTELGYLDGVTSNIQTQLNGKISNTMVGAANGVAPLDSNGLIPSSRLPSYVDDVIEGYYKTADKKFYKESGYTTVIPSETGKIYVDLTTLKTYRWSGSAYVEISASLTLGETSSTAYPGDKGKELETGLMGHVHTVTHTPAGSVSQPTFTGTEATISAAFTPSGTVSQPEFTGTEATISTKFTPAGSVSQPTFTGTQATISATYKPAGSVSQPTFTGSQGAISATYTPSGTISTPTFTGTAATISADYTPSGTVSKPTFTGSQATISTKFTPAGTISRPTFTGSQGAISATYTPAGTVSKPTFSGTQAEISATYTPAGTVSTPTFTGTTASHDHTFTGTETTLSVNYTPGGAVSAPIFTGTQATSLGPSNTDSVYSISSVGTIASLSTSVSNQCLTFSFNGGTTPTRTVVTVPKSDHTHKVTATGTNSVPTFVGTAATLSVDYTPEGTISSKSLTPAGTISQPTFAGTQATIKTNYKPAGSVSQPTFTGTQGTAQASYTPSGTISIPTFTGTESTISATYTPSGTVSQPSFAGTEATIEASYTPAGTVSKPTFTGTQGTAQASYTPSGTVSKPTFTGTQATISTAYTPSGSVSQPTFKGNEATISTEYTPSGTVSQPIFTGTLGTAAGKFKPSGTVSKPTFTGTQATIDTSVAKDG